jgi:hypothetical protein
MARDRNSLNKRLREAEKKRKADDKRKRREGRKRESASMPTAPVSGGNGGSPPPA